jgi:hypothetical protein
MLPYVVTIIGLQGLSEKQHSAADGIPMKRTNKNCDTGKPLDQRKKFIKLI